MALYMHDGLTVRQAHACGAESLRLHNWQMSAGGLNQGRVHACLGMR